MKRFLVPLNLAGNTRFRKRTHPFLSLTRPTVNAHRPPLLPIDDAASPGRAVALPPDGDVEPRHFNDSISQSQLALARW